MHCMSVSYKHMPLKYKRPWSEVPIHKVLTEEIHLWHCRNMNLYFFRSFSLAQVICCPFGGASAQFQSCQHYWHSLRNNKKIQWWITASNKKKNLKKTPKQKKTRTKFSNCNPSKQVSWMPGPTTQAHNYSVHKQCESNAECWNKMQ